MANPVELALDGLVVGLAMVTVVAYFRLRHHFAQGASEKPIHLLALSPLLMVIAEVGHITGEFVSEGAVRQALGLVHTIGEALFFVALTYAGVSLLRSWKLPGRAPTPDERRGPGDEAERLSRIVNQASVDLEQITGPAFARALFRRASTEATEDLPTESHSRMVAKLRPEIQPEKA